MLVKAYSEFSQASKMKIFVKIISKFQSLTILAKNSIFHQKILTGFFKTGLLCFGICFLKV